MDRCSTGQAGPTDIGGQQRGTLGVAQAPLLPCLPPTWRILTKTWLSWVFFPACSPVSQVKPPPGMGLTLASLPDTFFLFALPVDSYASFKTQLNISHLPLRVKVIQR